MNAPVRQYQPPTQYDYDRAIELVDALGPVEQRAVAIEMAANVIGNARLKGVVDGLIQARRAMEKHSA